jgi:hypothetical protein
MTESLDLDDGRTVIDVDKLPAPTRKPPFLAKLGNEKVVTFLDPQEIVWSDLLKALTDPTEFFRSCLSPADHEAFLATQLPIWKLIALVNAYTEHYQIDPTTGRGPSR